MCSSGHWVPEKRVIAGILILVGFGVAKMFADKGEFSSIVASSPWIGHGEAGKSATWNELFWSFVPWDLWLSFNPGNF